jgi:hypothetical protein
MPTADQFNQRGQTNLPGLLGIDWTRPPPSGPSWRCALS